MCAPVRFTGSNFRKETAQEKLETIKATDEAAKGEPMTETKQTSTTKTDRRPDCVTEIRMGNSVLTVSGFFKQGATDTAADKMMKVLEAEAATQKNGDLTDHKRSRFDAFAAIQTAAPCGTIKVRNSGAGCRKRRILC